VELSVLVLVTDPCHRWRRMSFYNSPRVVARLRLLPTIYTFPGTTSLTLTRRISRVVFQHRWQI